MKRSTIKQLLDELRLMSESILMRLASIEEMIEAIARELARRSEEK